MKTIFLLSMLVTMSVGCAIGDSDPEPVPCEETEEGCEEPEPEPVDPPNEGAPCKAEIECDDGMWCVITDSPTEGTCQYVGV